MNSMRPQIDTRKIQPGLGVAFVEDIDHCASLAAEHPLAYAVVREGAGP